MRSNRVLDLLPLLFIFLCFPIAVAFAQSAQVPTYQYGVFPSEPPPVIPPGDEIIIYIHGGPGSRLEEASDLVKPLLDAGLARGKRYTIISFDQPSQGYSSMRDPSDIVPDHNKISSCHPNECTGYYPLVAASEEFIVGLVNELDKIVPIKNRNIYFIGGSTGGMLALRMGHRSEAWIKKIVAWNPASVWNTYARFGAADADGWAKGLALDTAFNKLTAASREDYFQGVFGAPLETLFAGGLWQFVVGMQPNPEEWYRGDRDQYASSGDTQKPFRKEWACKWDHISGARLEMQEVYNPQNGRWHFRLGTEELLFSFFNDSWTGPANPASVKTANFQSIIKPTLLVASDDDDWNEGYIPEAAVASFTAWLGTEVAPVEGTVIGGLVGGVVGVVAGPIYFHWENRWSRTREMASLKLTLPLFSALYLPNTGHSIHNERPNLFATQIVQFLTDGPLTTTYDPNLADNESCQLELPSPSRPQPSQFAPVPPQFLDDPGAAAFLMEPARLGGHFSDGSDAGKYSLRLNKDLNARCSPASGFGALCALAKAAARYYQNDTLWGNAFADLAVTGRNSYNAFTIHPPTENDIKIAIANERLISGTLDDAKLTNAIHAAQDRAYQIIWALRNPNPDAAYRFRSQLGCPGPAQGCETREWIAVSGEDDPPARPVNVPSGIPVLGKDGKTQVSAYPQYELQIAVCPNLTTAPYVPLQCEPFTQGSVPFQIRYTVAGLPEIIDMSPSSIPVNTSTTVTISGANLVDIKSVSQSNFGFTVESPTNIKINIPPLQAGIYPIQVSTSAGYSSRTVSLTVAPVIASISPTSGPITGGTPVSITGTGFNPTGGATDFFFGQHKGTLTACNTSEQCITYSPQGAGSDVVDVQARVQLSPGSLPVLSQIVPADKFSYTPNPVPIGLGLPNTFFGMQSATVSLNGIAPQGGASITLTKDGDPNNVVGLPPSPPSVGSGTNSITFPLEFRPVSVVEDVTLAASFGGGKATAIAHLVPWPTITVLANWANVSPTQGGSAIVVTVFLNGVAPIGGANILLSSKPSVFSDRTVTINGSYWTTVTIPVRGSGTTTPVMITAKYNDASASTSMVFLCAPKTPCRKGTYWDNLDCRCEVGIPK